VSPRFYLFRKRTKFRWRHARRFDELQRLRRSDSQTYSLKPYDQRRCIFVHIPKCAGVAVAGSLFGNLGGGHLTFDDYTRIFSPGEVLSYFKFTIVRNPWDRLLSAFRFLRQGGFSAEDRAWAEANISSFADFDEFVRAWVNRENIWAWYHFRPQYHYIREKHDRVRLDFIGRLESIEDDFACIADRLGCSRAIPKVNQSASGRVDYVDYYTPETVAIVAEAYREDIDLLGYSFGDSPNTTDAVGVAPGGQADLRSVVSSQRSRR